MRVLSVVIGVVLFTVLEPMAFAAKDSGEPTCAKSYITLRKGPSDKDAISWRVARYMPFLRHESKNSWVRVEDLEGESHWAKARDLTGSTPCVVVRAQIATLRKGPSTSAEPTTIRTVDKYTPFKKLEIEGDWVKVESETGHQGWIHQSTVWRPVKVHSVVF